MKYVMIVNINPGFVYGGSATQYFVGEFDGKEFHCDSKPETVKWLDWEKTITPPSPSPISANASWLCPG